MNYLELKQAFCDWKRKHPTEDLTAHIIFTEDSFTQGYSLLSRTYRITSGEKVFWSKTGSRSIFADCLDGTDQGVRLDWYLADEGNPGGWKVQDCYILEYTQDTDTISSVQRHVQDDGTVAYFFGDTTVRAYEAMDDEKICLKPTSGDQVACGEWVELAVDKVHGYCFLLEKFLNGGENR